MLQPVVERVRVKKKKKGTNKKGASKKRELLLQFRNLTERYHQLQQQMQPLPQFPVSRGSSISNDGGRLDELDTSFFSDRQYLHTNGDDRLVAAPTDVRNRILNEEDSVVELNATQSAQLVHELDEQEAREMAEIRSIEQQAA